MAVYYVRKNGSDAAAGTSPGAAWLTIGKALLAGGMATGDTCYVGAGIYREANVTVGITPTTTTSVIADCDGTKTGDAGEVTWTAYATNDTTAPAATTSCLDLNGKNFLYFQGIHFVGGQRSGACGVRASSATKNITFKQCSFINALAANTTMNPTLTVDVAANWTIDQCIFFAHNALSIGAPTSSVADYDLNFQITNCVFLGTSATAIAFTPSGALSFKPGGVDVLNCTFLAKSAGLATAANTSTTFPCTVYNCFIHTSSLGVSSTATGQILEDYNILWCPTPRTNVATGTNSISGDPIPYAPLIELGQAVFQGRQRRQFGAPMLSAPFLGFGNQAGGPTVDLLGLPRPSGPAITKANALNAAGAYERGNTATKETTTVRTGSNALKILGPGTQDFEIAVNAVSTTVTVYGRYDSSYAGTLPAMSVLNGEEAGVTAATATMVAAVNTWEQLSLTFTPTSAGIVTVRLRSSSTAGAGAAFFDDFNAT